MALIGKIRNNLWFVLILLGLALAAFVIMDMTSASNLGGASQMTMGEVNGDKIDYRSFQTAESVLYSGSSSDIFATRNQLWDYFVENTIVNQEAEKLGLGVGFEELQDLQFGENLSPIIQQSFSNPQTRQIDRAQLNQIKQAIENDDLNPQFKSYWREQEKQIIKARTEEKLNTMVSKAMFSPVWMAEKKHSWTNDKVDFAYVKIPFDDIDGTGVEVSDADYASYIKENSSQYTNDEETRNIKYLVFDVLPTADDSTECRTQMADLMNRFKETPNDSTFALSNNGFYTFIYSTKDQLPEDIKENVDNLENGDVDGPYLSGTSLRSYKLIDAKAIPDSVKARHILKRVDPSNPLSLTQAESLIDSLLTVLQKRTARFDSLAIKFSDDPGSKIKGGDLGYFAQGAMVPPFNNACFVTGKEREYKVVKTQFGIHLIHIQDQKYESRDKKYKIAFIEVPILPSKETQDDVYDKVDDYVSAHSSIESLETAIADVDDLEIETASGLKANDFLLENLGSGQSSRDIIRWAFNGSTDEGDLASDVFTYTDQVNYFDSKYVIAGLDKIVDPGLKSVESVKDDIHTLIFNKKKAEKYSSEIANTDMAALASQFEISVDTARSVSFSVQNVPGIGAETKVIGAAFRLNPDELSEPIVGESGVYKIKVVNNTPSTIPANIADIRLREALTNRSKVPFQLMEALKKKAKIEDQRSTFF
jgi:peptidyl-prolyl cis-trans isomerase D